MDNSIDQWFQLVQDNDYFAAYKVWQRLFPASGAQSDPRPSTMHENAQIMGEPLSSLHQFCVFAAKQRCRSPEQQQQLWTELSAIASTKSSNVSEDLTD